jgi:hypothetical protein
MLRRIRNKLCSCAGESIGETLIALLIAALALLMLAGAVSSASRIVTRNKAAMKSYYGNDTEDARSQKAIKASWDMQNDIVNLK